MAAITRRAFGFALGAIALSTTMPAAFAQSSFPNKPVTIIIGYPPGGPTDIYARVLGKALSEMWKQTVVIDNRPGASGTIGAQQVLRAAPDGYTLSFTNNATNGAVELLSPKSTPFRTMRDFAPVALFGISPSLMVARSSLGVKDAKEFVALARSQPGKLSYGSSAVGSAPHMASELFQSSAGIKMLHVPYSGAAPIIQALLGDNIDMYIGGASTVMGQVKTGRLRVIGTVHPTRLKSAPDVPTMAEQGFKNVEYASWFGLLASSQVPGPVLEQINAAVRKVMESPELKAQVEQLGVEYMSLSRQQFQSFLQDEVDKTARIITEQKMALE